MVAKLFPEGTQDLSRAVVVASVLEFYSGLTSEPGAFIERKARGIQLRQSRPLPDSASPDTLSDASVCDDAGLQSQVRAPPHFPFQ